MNTHVNFEIAKLLKEKGFDKPCNLYYYVDNNIHEQKNKYCKGRLLDRNCYDNQYSVPTLLEVITWLYDKYGIWVSVQYKGVTINKELIEFQYDIQYCKQVPNLIISKNSFSSPRKAYREAIDYVLNKVI